MSYILDALTKAAQQRDRRVPVIQRLLAPAVRMPRSPWARSLGRLAVVLAVNAGLLTVLLVWWLQPVAEPPVPPPAQATAPTAAEAPRSAAVPRSVVEPARPGSVEPPRAVAEPRRSAIAEPARPATAGPPAKARAETPAPAGRSVAAAPPTPVVAPQAPPPAPVPIPQRPMPSPQAPPLVGAPLTPVGPGTPPSPARPPLKLEALIYSDVPSERMVFINGRRYAEGDTVEGRLRVEEIHEDGVDLSEQGRRTTLRAAR